MNYTQFISTKWAEMSKINVAEMWIGVPISEKINKYDGNQEYVGCILGKSESINCQIADWFHKTEMINQNIKAQMINQNRIKSTFDKPKSQYITFTIF